MRPPKLQRILISAHQSRFYTTVYDVQDIRARLLDEVKAAMKAKDAVTSTTLRSILSEIYAADKQANEQVSSPTIVKVLRKAIVRRNEAAATFSNAARLDLAEKELRETVILSKFLPPLLSEAEIDAALRKIIGTLPADINTGSLLGYIFKKFYQQVDKSVVDTNLVKQRASSLLANK